MISSSGSVTSTVTSVVPDGGKAISSEVTIGKHRDRSNDAKDRTPPGTQPA